MSAFDDIKIPAKEEAPQPPVVETEQPAVAADSETPEAEAQAQTPVAEPSGDEARTAEATSEQLGAAESDLDKEIESRKAKDGDNWAIRAYREKFEEVRKLKPVSELVAQHGTPVVRTGTEIAALYLDPESPIDSLASRMAEVSPSRASELRDHYWAATAQAFPDETLQVALGDSTATLDEVKAALEAHRGKAVEQPVDDAWSDADPDDLSSLPPALRKEIEEFRAIKGKLPGIEQELSSFRTERETAQERARTAEVQKIENDLFSSVIGVVESRKKDLGLEVKPEDPPKVQTIKRQLARLIDGDIIPAFDRVPENQQVLARAKDFAKRLERENAFAFEDKLKISAANAFNEVLQTEDAKNLLDALKSELAAHALPRNPAARPELVNGSTAPFTPPDAFAEGRKEGLSPFDVAQRLARQSASAAPTT